MTTTTTRPEDRKVFDILAEVERLEAEEASQGLDADTIAEPVPA